MSAIFFCKFCENYIFYWLAESANHYEAIEDFGGTT